MDLLQLGQTDVANFESITFGAKSPSAYNVWPEKTDIKFKEYNKHIYKYNSIFLELRQER